MRHYLTTSSDWDKCRTRKHRKWCRKLRSFRSRLIKQISSFPLSLICIWNKQRIKSTSSFRFIFTWDRPWIWSGTSLISRSFPFPVTAAYLCCLINALNWSSWAPNNSATLVPFFKKMNVGTHEMLYSKTRSSHLFTSTLKKITSGISLTISCFQISNFLSFGSLNHHTSNKPQL